MKNYSLRIIFTACLLQCLSVFADPPATVPQTNVNNAAAAAAAAADLSLIDSCASFGLVANYNPNTLKIMGKTIAEIEPGLRVTRCVHAANDADASIKCQRYGNTVINPGNPQYSWSASEAESQRQYGGLRSNVDHEYYCATSPRTIPVIKAARCTEANSDDGCTDNGRFRFVMVPARPGSNDGNCLRQGPGLNDNMPAALVCANATSDYGTPFGENGPEAANVQAAGATNPPPSAQPASTPERNVRDPLALLNQCMTRWRERGQGCKTGAENAVRSCESTRDNNNTINGISGALGALGQGVTALNQGQGVQGTCFKAGAAALAARAALDTTKQNCTAGENFCSSSCQVSQMDGFIADCLQAAGYSDLAQLRTEHSDMATNLETQKNEITELFTQGSEICSTQVRTRRMSLDSAVSDLGRTLQASTVCACQTSSSNSTNCNQIPVIDTCQANPAAAGCQAYVPITACATGNAQACACAQNPSAPGCTTTVTPPTVSNFAGNLATGSTPLNSGGGSSFAGGGGSSSGGGSFSDLSIPGGGAAAVPANFANNLKPGEVSTGAGATGASVGGGGNGSGGLAGGSVSGTAGPPAEKNLGALFKDLKNVVSNVFGGGSRSSPSAQKANGGINTDRFKPSTQLRGGPVQRDVASANEKTLFELVNECANGLRCKNSGNLMVNP